MADASNWVEADKLCTALKKRVPCLAGTQDLTLFNLAKIGSGPCASKFEKKLESLLCFQYDECQRNKAYILAELEQLICSDLYAFVTTTLSRMPWQAIRRLSGQLDRQGGALHAVKAARMWMFILSRLVALVHHVCAADEAEIFRVLSGRHARPTNIHLF